jgi:hypothetical protein
MQLIQAQLTSSPRTVQTKFGLKVVADAIDLNSGEHLTVWRPEGDRLSKLSPNARVVLAKDSKGKVILVDNPPSKSRSIPANAAALSNEQKREIADYVQQQRALLAFCWKQALLIPGPTQEDVVEKLAVTLYLSTQRKFNLT